MDTLLALLVALVAAVSKVAPELGRALEGVVALMKDKWEDSLDKMDRVSQELGEVRVELENSRNGFRELDDALVLRELMDSYLWEVRVSCNALISHKIICIRAMKEVLGLSLLEAKHEVERLIMDKAYMVMYNLSTGKMIEALNYLTRSDVSSVDKSDMNITLV